MLHRWPSFKEKPSMFNCCNMRDVCNNRRDSWASNIAHTLCTTTRKKEHESFDGDYVVNICY